ncbi:LOW QUALITY PROTEIN: sushi domain-containing protein 5 [Fundulus heteroclitus]|uniref:LOW QUALITY PROTEIN: sushi domain-containing protein 5 n=1 Tax=Fundulus heteroclitus TaxID=8078 RepID=UPI00165ADC50|nr:LOW QUALITY PROTEIN: sushi domain-containing protein 5 [Fundulus heteroclitus]
MLYCSNQIVQSLLFGCLTFLVVTSVVHTEGRVFVLDLRSLQGFREAEQACASQHARLASAEELHRVVAECFFSHCTRGWLYGGMVGTTVCNTEGSSLKVNVKTENATEASAHLSAFCTKDKAVACGDPPSFPNARLQDHSGFEMGDELLYTCVPGYVMPSGSTAFSLLCDSCGEWYGTVQICVKDAAETHVDYDDKFENSHEEADRDHDSREEVFRDASRDEERTLQQQETRFWMNVEDDSHEVHTGVKAVNNSRTSEPAVDEVARREEDGFTIHPRRMQEGNKLVQAGDGAAAAAAATEEPVSLLSQKHMFWFPSEAFQEEVPPFASDSVTQATQRASGAQSEESKENESQERLEITDPDDDDHHDLDNRDDDRHDHRHDDHDDHYDEPDDHDDHHDHHDDRHDHDDHDDHDDHHDERDDHHDGHDHDDDGDELHKPDTFESPDDDRDDDDHDDSRHDDLDIHEDDHTGNHEDPDSRQEEDFEDHVKTPAQFDDLDRPDRHKDDDDGGDDHDDHYDMGEHEDDGDRASHGTQEYDDRADPYDDHRSKEDHHDDHRDHGGEHPDNSEEHPESDDHDDGEERDDLGEDDFHDKHDDKDESYDDHDSHEDSDDHPHVVVSVSSERRPNITQREAGGKTSKDNSWLDGHPVDLSDTENGDSTKRQLRPSVAKTTDKPSDVEVHRRVPHNGLSDGDGSPTVPPKSDHEAVKEVWPGFRTPATSSDRSNPNSNSDTLDYDTQQAAPTHSWLDDLTDHPFLDHGPAPPVRDGDAFPAGMEEHTVDNLPGEMGEMEGEKRKTICAGEDCPPHPPSSTSQGAKVAAIIVAVCAVATAVIVGVWCYRRKQQKSSMYEMNGKGQGQSRQGQQIEMQQKV